ncbi:pentapeptide repeat-containing protein [Actinoplanes sp. CA-142083]|uniref:pentapeptide repeat-containing protein n=1 Tax=Actinoplanes sp. CA-142083 TaxID=3239903 RepID=UPI003D8E1C53
MLERVGVTGSRMTGLAWNDGLLSDVTFTDCKVDLTNWRFARFDVVTFTDCNLAGADFTHADLRGATFTRCDLSRAQFHNASMEGARFRGCELQGIGGLTSWAGAIVHPDDLLALSYALAGALGITVSDSSA